MELVETSKTPSKYDGSSSSAGPFDAIPRMSRIGVEKLEESECWRKARFSPAFIVAARMVYRGASVFGDDEIVPVDELRNRSRLFKIVDKMVTHPLVVVLWGEVSFPAASSFPNNIFAVIGAFNVFRFREELMMKVPWMPTFEVIISMFLALTD